MPEVKHAKSEVVWWSVVVLFAMSLRRMGNATMIVHVSTPYEWIAIGAAA